MCSSVCVEFTTKCVKYFVIYFVFMLSKIYMARENHILTGKQIKMLEDRTTIMEMFHKLEEGKWKKKKLSQGITS